MGLLRVIQHPVGKSIGSIGSGYAALNMVIMWWHLSTTKMEGISVISSACRAES